MALMESFLVQKNLFKLKVTKPNPVEVGIAVAKIANDFAGAYRASLTNEEITSRLVAQLWLDAKFQSAGDRVHMSRLVDRLARPLSDISFQDVNLTGLDEQIESIALFAGSSGVLCDVADFYSFGLVNCDGVGVNYEANYDKALVMQIINNYISQANSTYRDLVPLVNELEVNKQT